jgi:hypothetical protein
MVVSFIGGGNRSTWRKPLLNLKLPVQSVPITTNMSLHPAEARCTRYDINYICDKICDWHEAARWFHNVVSSVHLAWVGSKLTTLVVIGLWLWFMVFNTTFNNTSLISWRSVLLVEETSVPRENHRAHYVINFVSNLRDVSGFLQVLRFPPPIKLTTTI